MLEQLGRNIDTMKKTYDDVMTKYNGKQGIANTSKNIHNLLRGAETQTLSDSINTNYTLGNNNEN